MITLIYRVDYCQAPKDFVFDENWPSGHRDENIDFWRNLINVLKCTSALLTISL